MSEVNQAFLRAYLKNRANETIPTSAAPTSIDTRGPQNPVAARPSAAAPRPPMGPSTHPSQSLPSGMNLRFDPAHGTQQAPSPLPQVAAIPFAAPANLPSAPERVAPRQGVWSPAGAERGMKALERQSSPAVVRNGVVAITPESTQYRRPTAPAPAYASPSQPPVTNPPATATRSASVPPVSNVGPSAAPYDQVMYIDGLVGHTQAQRSPGSRPSERTLAEIAEPIAFGTGVTSPATSPTPVSKREQPMPPQASRSQAMELHARSVAPEMPRPVESGPSALPNVSRDSSDASRHATVNRRFDTSHQRPIDNNFNPQVMAATAPPVPTAPSAPMTRVPASPTPLPLPVAFNPSWEVDQFFWPEVVKQIEASHADAFQQIGKHLNLANRDGLKVMAITSGERGVGRSTVAMHMARCAASAGLRVALVDGDTFCPSLIDQLRLDMQQGWQDCLFENVPLHDIAIHSIADQITLFPLTSAISQQQVHANLHRMVKLIRRISNAFDMVFIDGNRLNLEQRNLVGVAQESVVDAAIVVTDTELSIKEKVDTAVSLLQAMGISSIGLVENFQS